MNTIETENLFLHKFPNYTNQRRSTLDIDSDFCFLQTIQQFEKKNKKKQQRITSSYILKQLVCSSFLNKRIIFQNTFIFLYPYVKVLLVKPFSFFVLRFRICDGHLSQFSLTLKRLYCRKATLNVCLRYADHSVRLGYNKDT